MHTNRLRDLEILDSQFTGMHRQCKPLGDKSNNLEPDRRFGAHLTLPDLAETKLREKRAQPVEITSR
jgi:hypothetical protein